MKQLYILAVALVAGLSACKKSGVDIVDPERGDVDFTTYVAIGNSLTAGYADGSLYRSAQLTSYPAILAQQFRQVGGGDFNIPLLPGNAGWPSPKRVLAVRNGCDGEGALSPVFFSGVQDTAGSMANISGQGPFNNVAVPGMRCVDYMMPGYAEIARLFAGVGYAHRFYDHPLTQSPLDVTLKRTPTFFTVWLGGNDVLGYALSGGEGNGAGGVLPSDISLLGNFTSVYDLLIDTLAAIGAKGVLLNIPDITTIPYFTAIPANGLILDETEAETLSNVYTATGIRFAAGANYFMIQDVTAPGGARQIRDGELLLLSIPQDSLKCAGWGGRKPIPRSYVLDAAEIGNIQTATIAFNQVIQNAAQKHGLAYMDADAYMKTLQSGIVYNGVTYTTTFVTGGAFSLDGIHLTPRGYALVANEIIRTINARYGSTISLADVNRYDGVHFP